MKPISTRIISGVVYLLTMVAGICIEPLFPFVFSFIITVVIYEYHEITLGKRFMFERILVIFSSLILFNLLYLYKRGLVDPVYLYLSFVPTLLAAVSVLHSSVKDCEPNSFENEKIEDVFFPLLYIAIPLSSAVLLQYPKTGFNPKFLLSLLALVCINDIGAYIFGMGFGQRPNSKKFSPKLSPKKSWWGFWGGCIASTIFAIIFGLTFLKEVHIIHTIVVGLIIGIFSIYGDLFESLIKRRAQVKDSGRIMPGHGGLLDRFDSMLLVLPLVVIYLKIAGVL